MTMNTLPVPVTPRDYIRRKLWQLRSFRYLWVALFFYALIVAVVLLYLSRAPIYASAMSVVLPGSGSSSSFSIDQVGQANQSTRTPFGSAAFSPLVNYKEILKSREVMRGAAEKLNVQYPLLTPPRVELRERTSILFIHVDGGSPASAQAYAEALYESFQEALDRLREDEIIRRDSGVERVLAQYRNKVAATRQAIVEFQQRALLISQDQVAQLMNSQSALQNKRMTSHSQLRKTEDYVNQLSIDLAISPALVGQAFKLQSDAEFRGYLRELDDSAMKLAEYSSTWGYKHPKVVAQQARYDGVKESLLTRSKKVVGIQIADALHGMDLQSAPQRADLFSSLLDAYARLQGLKAEISDMDISEQKLADRMKIYSREAAELERLEREHALAEAVYTSAAAKLEAGKSDIFASYPAVQILSIPSYPDKPKSPNTGIAIAIGGLGILFITFGLFTLWHRDYLIALVLKNT
ncbi:hypothetical protein QFX18_01695 [Saccharophagus degradans]|uniref:GumC family protein n=1 Tax=Saccharophagus degradans TaxID=86304 RepID=UPI002477E341|nr:hypothetical protein [Saccharophagus degradans]WGO98773.1 hypothetical protein QFX18_01695 [Saccharophagus degradans]